MTESGMVKVADFGTSRFLEIAAHGTTVIGSPPYMAPEQFHGKAVFACDLYSLGVTMYQMLTGDAALRHAVAGGSRPADARRAAVAPRLKNPKIPKAINDIVIKAMAPDDPRPVPARRRSARRRARGARAAPRRRRPAPSPAPVEPAPDEAQDIQTRLQGARDAAAALLLALPQAAARALRSLPVLRRNAVARQHHRRRGTR